MCTAKIAVIGNYHERTAQVNTTLGGKIMAENVIQSDKQDKF